MLAPKTRPASTTTKPAATRSKPPPSRQSAIRDFTPEPRPAVSAPFLRAAGMQSQSVAAPYGATPLPSYYRQLDDSYRQYEGGYPDGGLDEKKLDAFTPQEEEQEYLQDLPDNKASSDPGETFREEKQKAGLEDKRGDNKEDEKAGGKEKDKKDEKKGEGEGGGKDGQHAAEGKAKGRGRGKGKGKGRKAAGAKGEGSGDSAAESTPRKPNIVDIPTSESGNVPLTREPSLRAAPAPAFVTPGLPAARIVRAPGAKAEPAGREQAQAAAAFQDAMSAVRRLYEDLLADAAAAADRVQSNAGRMAALRQGDLDRGLDVLVASLRQSRASLDACADSADHMIDSRARQTAVAIGRAAGVALRALNSAAGGAAKKFSDEEKKKDSAKRDGEGKVASIDTAGTSSSAAVRDLDSNKEWHFPLWGEPMDVAKNEKIGFHIGTKTTPAAKAYADEAAAEVKSLKSTFEAMGKAADKQFTDIGKQVNDTAASSRESVEKSRDGALGQLRKSGEEIHGAVAEARSGGHAALVRQHNQSRRQLTATLRERARSENIAAQQRSTRGSASILALATAQQTGAKVLSDTLKRDDRKPPAEFAKTVSSSASTFAKTVGRTRGDQRTRLVKSAETAESAPLRQSDSASSRMAGSAADMARRMGEAGEGSEASLTRQTEKSLEPFDKMAEPVADSGKATVKSAKAAYASHGAGAEKAVKLAQDAVTSAWEGKGGGGEQDKKEAAPAAKSDGPTAKEVPSKFQVRAGKIATEAESDEAIAAFLKTTREAVRKAVVDKAAALYNQLINKSSTSIEAVMEQLRSITGRMGKAVTREYRDTHHRSLRSDLKFELRKLMSAGSTDDANVAAALAYLDGNHVAGALQEMKAAVNYSNDEGRVEKVQRSLTPAELGQLNEKYPDQVKEIVADLDGHEQRAAEALNTIEGEKEGETPAERERREKANVDALGLANAFQLKKVIDQSREKRGEEGGDATAEMLAQQRESIGNDVLSGADPMGPAFEDPDATRERKKKLWQATSEQFAKEVKELPDGTKLEGAPGEKGGLSAIARYASAARPYQQFVPDGSEAGGHYETVKEGLDPNHAELIDAIVTEGPDSEKAAAATIMVELNRKSGPPREDKLRKALGSDMLAAVEGESDAKRTDRLKDKVGPDGKIIKGALTEARERREKILSLVGQLDANAKARDLPQGEGAKGEPPSAKGPAEVKAQILETLDTKLAKDPTAKAYTKSMVERLEPDPVAAFDFALAHEGKNKETLLAATGRMNRDQIDAAVEKWDKLHPGEPLYKKLGMFERGKGELEGDARNDVELKFMGVPRNDRERAEVANMTTKQQIRDAGIAGPGMAAEEYQKMVGNQKKLLKIMGVTAGDIDSMGRIRGYDKDRNPIVGHFDKEGTLKIKPGKAGEKDRDAFETAMQLSSLHAQSYKDQVDKVAMGITMALMVIAAVVTTFVTFGGAAAIWGPILITAGAGMVGMAMTAALKGDRYTSAEIQRDLVMTFVQAATAGLGAYAGLALKGAGAAAKGAATASKVMGAVEKPVLGLGARALNLGKGIVIDAAIGGGTNAINSAAGAAMDSENRRQGKSGAKALDAAFRGFVSGAVGSVVTKPAGAVGKRFGAMGERVAGNVASGFTTRLTEARVGQAMGDPHQSWAESLETAKEGVVQDAIQAAGEHMSEGVAHRRAERRATAKAAASAQEQHAATPIAPAEAPTAPRKPSADPIDHLKEPVRPAPDAPAQEVRPTPAGPQHSPESLGRAAAVHEALPNDLKSAVDDALPVKPPAPKQVVAPGTEPPPAAEAQPRTAAVDGAPHPMPGEEHAGAGTPAEEPGPGTESAKPVDPKEAATKTLKAANDNGPGEHKISLSEVDLVKVGSVADGSVFVHPDSTNRAAANDNFGRLVLNDPTREVIVLRNPATGEYVVIQGAATTVGFINSYGHLISSTGDSRGKSWQAMLNSQGGHWVMEHHFHPNEPGQLHTSAVRRLPSGANADFTVIIREATLFGYEERSSRIYYIDDGHFAFTDFGVNTNKPDKPYWVNFPEPGTGKRVTHEFSTLADYHTFVGNAGGGTYPLPHGFTEPIVASVKIGAAPRALESGSTHASLTSHDVAALQAVTQGAANIPVHETHDKLRGMGLVGEPDSMARLHLALNERSLPMETRQALADMVHQATREHMVATGQLGADEKLYMMFHGAHEERTASLKKEGVDLSKIQTGQADDFGAGLYLSHGPDGPRRLTALENAELYTGRDVVKGDQVIMGKTGKPGEVFPFFVRERDLGTVVDVSTGGKHRAAWEDFVMRHLNEFGDRVMVGPRLSFEEMMKFPLPFGTFNASANRGAVFEGFLKHLAQSSGNPHLAAPHIVMGDLGGLFTSGFGHGEQATVRVNGEHLAKLLSEQIGFRTPGAGGGQEPVAHTIGGVMKPAVEGDTLAKPAVAEEEAKAKAKPPEEEVKAHPDEEGTPKPKSDETEEAKTAATTETETDPAAVAAKLQALEGDTTPVHPAAEEEKGAAVPAEAEDEAAPILNPKPADDDDYYALTGMHPPSDEPDQTKAWLDAVEEASNAVDSRPGPRNAAEAHERAPTPVKKQHRDAALARFIAENPAEGAILATLHGHNPLFAIAALESTTEAGRVTAAKRYELILVTTGVDAATARTLARQLLDVANVAGARYRAAFRHVVEMRMWSDRLDALPAAVRDMAVHSPLLLYLGVHHPALLQSMHSDFLAQPALKPTDITAHKFEDFASRRLTGHPAVQAETTDRRIVRFTSEADFNAAAASAAPHTRYEFGKLAYTTDAQGRVSVAEGVPVRTTGHRASNSLQTAIGNTGHATDVGFHLIAHIFGAVVNELTVVPGNGKRVAGDPDPNLNGSAYKTQFENVVRNVLDTTSQIVQVEVRCVYNSGNTTSRPDVFQVRFKTDHDAWVVVSFINKF
jgi:DNA/RNA non-specific endonuclease